MSNANSFLLSTFISTAWILFITVVLVPTPGFAQTATTTEVVAATTTEAVPAPVKWYTSDSISGELNAGDFVIGPGRVEAEVKPGETVVRYITVTNRISDNRIFELVVEDVAGGSGDSVIQLMGSEPGPYTLKDYISFPDNKITLALGERARIPVTITMPIDADPGGHYGSVLVTTVRDGSDEDPTDAPGTRSPIIARVGVLLFITVPGNVVKSGQTLSLSLMGKPWWFEKGPINFGIAYENTGSLHLNPYGELRITNMFGEEVGYQKLDPWFVLPKSLRTREVQWSREFLLGRYVAEVHVNRGYEDIIDIQKVVFWVLPWKIVAGMFVGLFIIFFCIRIFLRTFEFKRKGG